jgi:hypothetical protein
MRSFTHLMPGEVQGCIGCHESRHQRPRSWPIPNSVVAAPQDLQVPEWGLCGFDYASIVQPVWDKHCGECHNPFDATNELDLTGDRTDIFNVSYHTLADLGQGRKGSPYVNWIPTYNGHEANILEITPKVWGSHASKLADLLLAGHPDADGKRRVNLSQAELRRVFMWIDLNVPYYGTADTAHPSQAACRQIFPPELTNTMEDVYTRRCTDCHTEKDPKKKIWHAARTQGQQRARIENPELNGFLLAPLAKRAGGTEACGRAVFASKEDPDYQAVLRTFEWSAALLKETPRMDMPGAVPATCCTEIRRAEPPECAACETSAMSGKRNADAN